MTKTQHWPFTVWLKIAVTQLGISPSEFWKMSVLDWFVITRSQSVAPITKTDLLKMENDYEARK